MEVSGQLHAPATLLQGKSPWYRLDKGSVGHRAGLDAVVRKKKFPAPAGRQRPPETGRRWWGEEIPEKIWNYQSWTTDLNFGVGLTRTQRLTKCQKGTLIAGKRQGKASHRGDFTQIGGKY
jgi:hypothetical protein